MPGTVLRSMRMILYQNYRRQRYCPYETVNNNRWHKKKQHSCQQQQQQQQSTTTTIATVKQKDKNNNNNIQDDKNNSLEKPQEQEWHQHDRNDINKIYKEKDSKGGKNSDIDNRWYHQEQSKNDSNGFKMSNNNSDNNSK